MSTLPFPPIIANLVVSFTMGPNWDMTSRMMVALQEMLVEIGGWWMRHSLSPATFFVVASFCFTKRVEAKFADYCIPPCCSSWILDLEQWSGRRSRIMLSLTQSNSSWQRHPCVPIRQAMHWWLERPLTGIMLIGKVGIPQKQPAAQAQALLAHTAFWQGGLLVVNASMRMKCWIMTKLIKTSEVIWSLNY